MRVLNLVPNADSRFFTQQVRALDQRGVDADTLSVPGNRGYDDGETDSRSVTDYLRFYPRVLRESAGDYDLVHANYGLVAPHAIAQPSRPVVLSLWGTDLMGRYGWVARQCARFADAVVVMSTEMAAALGDSCYVIPHGVDFDRFAPLDRDDARAALDWDADIDHVLFPYPPERGVKDYPRAERVVEHIRERRDRPVELHTVTDVPHAYMPVYMNAADALLLTSQREGSPNAVKEALACNLPVVATNVGDVAERLDGVHPSFVCDSTNELVDGLDSVLDANTRSNGRDAVRDLSVERTSERLHGVYEAVLDAAEKTR